MSVVISASRTEDVLAALREASIGVERVFGFYKLSPDIDLVPDEDSNSYEEYDIKQGNLVWNCVKTHVCVMQEHVSSKATFEYVIYGSLSVRKTDRQGIPTDTFYGPPVLFMESSKPVHPWFAHVHWRAEILCRRLKIQFGSFSKDRLR